jgi:hypothetical protein
MLESLVTLVTVSVTDLVSNKLIYTGVLIPHLPLLDS